MTDAAAPAASAAKTVRRMPGAVWALGFVSLFMDVSSEMIHSLLPVFMVSVLGATALEVGLVEGVAEATAQIVKLFSGTLSDRLGKRKWITVAGYGLAAITKPLFPLAGELGWVLTARFVDRIGKGIRGAPRDALIGDLTPPELRGAAFGLRQAMDTVGAFAGPLVAIGLMVLLADDIRTVFWFAVIPAFISVAILITAVREPAAPRRTAARDKIFSYAGLRRLGGGFWWIAAVGAVLTLARFSEAFLVLRSQDAGLDAAFVPLVLVVMNVAYAASAYPAGALSDRIGRGPVLVAGCACLIVADVILAVNGALWAVMAGVVFWGLHMGLTQGLLASMVTDVAPAERRGTAFGLFYLLSGIAMLLASVVAGGLWDRLGASATFLAGAAFALLAVVLYGLVPRAVRSGG